MPLFRWRRKPPPEPAPEPEVEVRPAAEPGYWQRILETDQQRLLLRCVTEDLRGRGHVPRMEGAVLVIDRASGPLVLGLDNLAQVCAQHPSGDWADLVRAHFDSMPLRELPLPADFANARGMLRVRLYGSDTNLGEALRRPLTDSVAVVLVLDYPRAIQSVSSETLQGWGVSEDEAFSAAAEGTWGEPAPQREQVGDPDDSGFTVLHGESFYTASHVLHLPTLMPDLPPAGALLAIPNRHLVGVHLLRTASGALGAVGALIPFAADFHQRGPGAISPGLLWWRDGGFVDLPVVRRTDRAELHPPEEFTALLDALP
ncbi:MAG: hypothetical protein JWL78_316 [Chloroflexi bacterium]|nr:hypothetical protein [Chloroflexota bacterium]